MTMTTHTNAHGTQGDHARTEGSRIGGESAGGMRPPAQIWIGRGMSSMVIAFLLLASAFPKFFLPEIAEESMRQLGWSEKHLLLIAVVEVAGALLYAVPRTATLGAILLTGLLGGAAASHLRIDAPLFSHTLTPVFVGLLMWGALWLRSVSLRRVLPLTSRD